MNNWSPPVKISKLHTKYGKVAVVRDDLLSGGTKQRAAIPFLRNCMGAGIREFVYASPFSGYAQIALAVSCNAVNVSCSIFAENNEGGMSSFTKLASKFAKIYLADSLSQAEIASQEYEARIPNSMKVPLGFNTPGYKQHLEKELGSQWRILCNTLGFTPKNFWVSVGSGTLAETFRSIIPITTRLICVDVRVLPKEDDRICSIESMKNTIYVRAKESFQESSRLKPPIPSNAYYDSKLWQLIVENASNYDVWWNVAS